MSEFETAKHQKKRHTSVNMDKINIFYILKVWPYKMFFFSLLIQLNLNHINWVVIEFKLIMKPIV